MYRGRSDYTRLALESILERFGGRSSYRDDFRGVKELGERKACFVTLHMKSGELRGCIGTLSPYREDLMEEIIGNAKSAAFGDPRFMPVTEGELEDIEISVDVLSEAVIIEDEGELDPQVYGVIVVKGGQRGVLLPDLPGIDSAGEQIGIAMDKAGISSREGMEIYKFTVVRYH